MEEGLFLVLPAPAGIGQARLTASSAIQVRLSLPHRHFLLQERQLLLNNLREQWFHVRVEVAAFATANRGAPNLASCFEGGICWSDGVIRHHLENARQEAFLSDGEQGNPSGMPFYVIIVGPAGLEPATSGL